MAKPVRSFIDNLIPEHHRWKLELFKQWNQIIGPSMRNKVIIEKIDNGILMLGVSHPVWAQELLLLSPMIKDKINKHFGQEVIASIRFRCTGSKGFYTPTPLKKLQSVQQDLFTTHHYTSLNQQESATLDPVSDKSLQSIMTAYLIRCKVLKRGKKDEGSKL